MIFLFFFFVFWVGFSFIVANAAKSKGRDPVGWFFLAFIVSPLLAAIFLMAFGTNAPPSKPQQAVTATHSSLGAVHDSNSNSEIQALKDLSELHLSGTLSDAEFEREKAKIIG